MMREAQDYDIWEIGSDGPPPTLLVGAMEPGEQLLWAVRVPSARLIQRRLWGGAFCMLIAVFMFYGAPWGQSMSDYCASDEGRSCRKLYLIAWPGVVTFSYLSMFAFYLSLQSKINPWVISLAVTNMRAIQIDGRRPTKVDSLRLDGNKAQHWMFGVKFGKSKRGFAFNILDFFASDQAVYWANEGRLRPEFQMKAAA